MDTRSVLTRFSFTARLKRLRGFILLLRCVINAQPRCVAALLRCFGLDRGSPLRADIAHNFSPLRTAPLRACTAWFSATFTRHSPRFFDRLTLLHYCHLSLLTRFLLLLPHGLPFRSLHAFCAAVRSRAHLHARMLLVNRTSSRVRGSPGLLPRSGSWFHCGYGFCYAAPPVHLPFTPSASSATTGSRGHAAHALYSASCLQHALRLKLPPPALLDY